MRRPEQAHGPYIPAEPGWFGLYGNPEHGAIDEGLRRVGEDRWPIVAWDLADGGCEPVSACQPERGMGFDWLVRPDGTVQGARAGDTDIELYASVDELVEHLLPRLAAYRARVADDKAARGNAAGEDLA